MKLHDVYLPLTATPFNHNERYIELEPYKELKPYIKCFWGSPKPYRENKTFIEPKHLIIPDTCMDIIFNINYTENAIHSCFRGIDDSSFTVYNNEEGRLVSTFAIRFYSWGVYLFAEDSLKSAKNTSFDLDMHFSKLKKDVEPLLFDVANIYEQAQIVQNFLLKHIRQNRMNNLLMNSFTEIVMHRGNIETGKLAQHLHVSTRQLERIFAENIGLTPKKISSLVRYQYLWGDILFKPDFSILDAVSQYGYTDQAHLLHEFKRYHTMTIREAKRLALKHVDFLQD